MLNNQLDIICVGEALVDFIGHEIGSISKTGNYQRHLGGSPTNVSLNLAKLKLKVALVATLGRDGLGDYILEGLQASNIDVSNVRTSVLKPTSVIFYFEDRCNSRIYSLSGSRSRNYSESI
jgi:fructokinase